MAVQAARPALLFDLDGTLTDPFVGITRSVQYAMQKLGRQAPVADDLRWCIGPPLKSGIREASRDRRRGGDGRGACGSIASAIRRSASSRTSLIDGHSRDAGRASSTRGYFLSVATSKLKTYAGDIIDHFDLRRYFQVLHGSELDGRNAAKGDLVRHILATERIEAGNAVMIGDRFARHRRRRQQRRGRRSACSGAMATGQSSTQAGAAGIARAAVGTARPRRSGPARGPTVCLSPARDGRRAPRLHGLGTSRRGTGFVRSRIIHSCPTPESLIERS